MSFVMVGPSSNPTTTAYFAALSVFAVKHTYSLLKVPKRITILLIICTTSILRVCLNKIMFSLVKYYVLVSALLTNTTYTLTQACVYTNINIYKHSNILKYNLCLHELI